MSFPDNPQLVGKVDGCQPFPTLTDLGVVAPASQRVPATRCMP